MPSSKRKKSIEKSSKTMKKKVVMVEWIASIALLIALSLIYYLNLKVTTPRVIYLPAGSIVQSITYLAKHNRDVSTFDAYLTYFIGSPQKGWLYLSSTSMTKADYLFELTKAKAAMRDITLIPGETTYMFFKKISKELQLSFAALQKEHKKQSQLQEGAYVPETYQVPLGASEQLVVRILLQHSIKQHKSWAIKIFGDFNIAKWERFLIIASIIQKEAASIDEMSLISSVIYNRLQKHMPLQMDGTLNYGKYSHQKITAYRIRHDKSTFNTYKHKGLPIQPVCNVQFEAIKAAIFPKRSNFLYFVKGKNGKHRFSRYYSTHIKNIHVTK